MSLCIYLLCLDADLGVDIKRGNTKTLLGDIWIMLKRKGFFLPPRTFPLLTSPNM